MRTEAIEKGTGRSWADWLVFFEGIGAERLDHAEIAREVEDEGHATGWWAQAAVIHYEQLMGRRIEGQLGDGKFAANASKTVVVAVQHDRLASVEDRDRWKAYWRGRLADL